MKPHATVWSLSMMQSATVTAHVVQLPSIGVRWHRVSLVRPIRRMPIPAIYLARRAAGQAHTTPPVALLDCDLRPTRQWLGPIASALLMLLIILASLASLACSNIRL